jgi:hypothetical protein
LKIVYYIFVTDVVTPSVHPCDWFRCIHFGRSTGRQVGRQVDIQVGRWADIQVGRQVGQQTGSTGGGVGGINSTADRHRPAHGKARNSDT